jgi:ATP-dependent Clp protease adaptor protein ClpS
MSAEPTVVDKVKLAVPTDWSVVIMDDNTTHMDFVIGLLVNIFHHSEETAYDIMIAVHETGSGVAGTYCHAIAEQKYYEAQQLIKQMGMRLRIKLRQE